MPLSADHTTTHIAATRMSDTAAGAARVASLRSASSKKRTGAAAAASAAGATPIASDPAASTSIKLQPSPPTPLYEAEEMNALPPVKATTKAGAAAAAKGSLRRPLPLSITGPTRYLWLTLMWLQSLWSAYLTRLETHPVFTKSMTAAVISVLSDLLAQWLSGSMAHEKSPLHAVDWISVRNQFIIGFFMRGLPVHYWYLALTSMFRRYDGSQTKLSAATKQSPTATQAPGSSSGSSVAPAVVGKCPTWVVVAKVLVDQLTFGPLSNLVYFFVIGWFEDRALSLIMKRVHKDYAPLMIANWKIWPLVSLINFKYVPPALQVLFGNLISIFWTTYVVMSTR